MPRRDGLPTNQEMLADVGAMCRDIYIGAYNAVLEENLGIPDSYKGKPLSALYLTIYGTPEEPVLEGSLEQETIKVSPIFNEFGDALTDGLQHRSLPDDVREMYNSTAERIGTFIIGNESVVDFLSKSPVNPTFFNYQAEFKGSDRVRAVDTCKDKPTKQTIASAKNFAKHVLELLGNNELYVSGGLAIDLPRYEDDPPYYAVFNFDTRRDLPLNGRESAYFLGLYEQKMHQRLVKVTTRIHECEQALLSAETEEQKSGLNFAIQQDRESALGYMDAIDRVRRLLG